MQGIMPDLNTSMSQYCTPSMSSTGMQGIMPDLNTPMSQYCTPSMSSTGLDQVASSDILVYELRLNHVPQVGLFITCDTPKRQTSRVPFCFLASYYSSYFNKRSLEIDLYFLKPGYTNASEIL
jgi:hypothetical protein